VAGVASARVTVSPAPALRTAVAASPQIEGKATVSGAALASFALRGVASATAAVSGLAQAAFNPAGSVTASAEVTGSIIRTIRYPLSGARADCYATLEADAAVYVLAYPEPAFVIARVFGTYWEVGHGESNVEVSPVGDAQRIKHAAGTAFCVAQPTAAAQVDAFAHGEVTATAEIDADALYTSAAGIRYWAARGAATAVVTASAEPYVYGVELVVVRATVTGTANALRAAFGVATARALLSAEAERVYPDVASVTVNSSASATGAAITAARGTAQVSATGAATATARVNAAAGGAATGVATPTAQVIWLNVSPAPAFAVASGVATCHRAAVATGQPSVATVTPIAAARLSVRAAGNAAGNATGAADGVFHPKIEASGTVDVTSSCSGFNTVNEATQQLSTRIVRVGIQSRTVFTPFAARMVRPAGVTRRVAA
jgi:hypothetical protein